jgi:hypothetical protein
MDHHFRQLTLNLALTHDHERRVEPRNRTEPLPAQLTDLYRERVPVLVLNVSRSGLGIKTDERFSLDLPILIECEGLVIVGNVQHCMKAVGGGFILGMKIHQIIDIGDGQADSEKSESVKGAVGHS